MASIDTSLETLDSHAALAIRLVRSKPALLGYYRWLDRPAHRTETTQSPPRDVYDSLEALIQPLRADADRATLKETESTGHWLALICQYIASKKLMADKRIGVKLIAASLLPLYRCLATGRLVEGLSQTRQRLGDSLVLLGLVEQLQLETLLDSQVSPQRSPQLVLGELLQLELANIRYLISKSLDGYNSAQDDFDFETRRCLSSFRASEKLPVTHQVPDWASPQLLWILSNELASTRSELVLPRSWIDTPLPWSKITSHWAELERSLLELSRRNDGSRTSSLQSDPAGEAGMFVNSISTASPNEAAKSGSEVLETIDVIDEVLERELYRSPQLQQQAQAASQSAPKKNTSARREPLVIPKVIIGEISNHNDPAFANVVRRQVALGKQEDRSVCIAMVMVQAEDHRESQALSAPAENGLNRWQQKLVNWVCDHPELTEPFAFLTREGQLILVEMDTERNTMTRLLRQGLVEVITGRKNDESKDLSKVAIPAKFHAGISSISSPGASFEFEELIASAHRCFMAAERLGSASIKSIEVF